MSETTQLLRYGATDLVLRMIEAGIPVGDYELENPIGAIRHISHDITGTAGVRIRGGQELTAVEIQSGLLEKAKTFIARHGAHHQHVDQILELWERTLEAVRSGDHSLVDQEIDWAIKKRLVDEVAARDDVGYDHPRLEQIDMAYHDIHPERGLFHLLRRRGRAAALLDEERIRQAVMVPPATTRAALRGHFLSTARAYGAEHTVDWVHHKLVDRPLEALMVKDPFAVEDERLEALLDKLGDRSAQLRERTVEEREAQGGPLALSERYTLTADRSHGDPPVI